MQEVSANWKNAHRQTLLRESYVEVSLGIGDPEALADATSRDNGAIYISESPKIVSEVDKKIVPYATLEQNLWLLSGERKALPESDYGECGYIGDVLSDDTCVFSSKMPIVTIDFTELFIKPIPGVTITWSATFGEFAENFIVTAYKGETIVSQKEVVDNSSVTVSTWLDIAEYDRIEICVKKWCLPNHRPRIEEIFVGINMVYTKTEMFDYRHKQSVDPICTSLPKAEISFSIDNVNGDYNPYNENGISKYLMERQAVRAKYGLKLNDGTIEWIKGGTFYLSEWYAKQNGMTADFTARDLLEFMSATYHDDITEIKDRSLFDLATRLLESAELPLNGDGTPKWRIHNSLTSIFTTAPLPEDSIANCLQLIANAGKCVMYQDRTGTLWIKPMHFEELAPSGYEINSFNSYSKSEITLSKPIKEVRLKAYNYTMGDKGIESTSTEVSHRIGEIGETITVDNPLITYKISENGDIDTSVASDVCSWIATYLKQRMSLDFSWRADVRLDALDIVENKNDYLTNNTMMTDVEFKYSGAFRGTGKGKVISYG